MSTLSLIALSEYDKLCGYENYIAWKTIMEAHEKTIHKYWKNKITVPSSGTTEPSTVFGPQIQRPLSQLLQFVLNMNSAKEYELRENVALSSILISVIDISGSGLDRA